MENEYYEIYNLLQDFYDRENLMYNDDALKDHIKWLEHAFIESLSLKQQNIYEKVQRLKARLNETEKIELIKFVIDYLDE